MTIQTFIDAGFCEYKKPTSACKSVLCLLQKIMPQRYVIHVFAYDLSRINLHAPNEVRFELRLQFLRQTKTFDISTDVLSPQEAEELAEEFFVKMGFDARN